MSHARARERFWKLHGAREQLTIDLDATLVTAHSEKKNAAGNYQRGFGFPADRQRRPDAGGAVGVAQATERRGEHRRRSQGRARSGAPQIPGEHIERLEIQDGLARENDEVARSRTASICLLGLRDPG